MTQARRVKIGLIGPVLPFRGGIAQYTTQLHRALMEIANPVTISFLRQYPAWLFPGQSDRDPFREGHREPGVIYSIDPYRPSTWLRSVERLRTEGVERVILPWWTAYWALCYRFIAVRLRRHGIPVTFLCHNVSDHEASRLKDWAYRLVLNQGDDYLVHSEPERVRLAATRGSDRVRVHPHPLYTRFPIPQHRLPHRAGLEILFFGFVRPYKGLDVLVDALTRLPDRDFRLTIAGEFWSGESEMRARINATGLDDRIDIRPRYHSDEETAELFTRADCVVLPYRSASSSGVLALAYHYDKPVVVTRVGGLPEVVDEGLSGFIVEPGDATALAGALERCRGFVPCPETMRRLKQKMSWDSLARTLIQSGPALDPQYPGSKSPQ